MKKLYFLSCLLLISAIIGMLNWFTSPTMSDDLMYRFVWQEDWQQPFQQIRSFHDVISSQLIHYYCTNGRSITHGLAQVIVNLVPENIAAIINTAMLIILIGLVVVYTTHQKEYRFFTAIVSFGLLFLVIKDFGSAFTWLLGAIVYLWALVFTMSFLIMLRWLKDKPFNWKFLPLIVLSFFAGWSHEAIALPLSLSFALYLFLHRENIFHRTGTYCMLAYVAGMLMIISSPALWSRANIDGITLANRLINGCINIVFGIRISWLLIITLMIILYHSKQRFIITVNKYTYLLSAWLVAISIVFVCGISADRITICAEFLALLVVVQLWQETRLVKYESAISLAIVVISVFVAIPAIRMNALNYQYYSYHRHQLEDTNNRIIKIRQLPVNSSYLNKQIFKRYVNPTVEFNSYNCYMAFDQHDINNIALATLYNKDYVVLLPEDVINHIQLNRLSYLQLGTDQHQNLYIYRLKRKGGDIRQVVFKLGPEVPLHLYQKILSYPHNEYELNSINFKTLSIHQQKYLVMTIPPSNIKRRIKEIHIK